MIFNPKKFLSDHDIPFWEKGKNVTDGWINICCPLCNDKSNHGGFNPASDYYNCWRCGHHFLDSVIMELLSCSKNEAEEIIENYSSDVRYHLKKEKKEIKNNTLKLPYGAEQIKNKHKKYLMRRNFDPEKIIKEWKILGTDYLGEYKFRIIIPVFKNNRMISFQGRDITGKSELRYKSCKIENEIIPYKNCIYGIDKCNKNKIVVTEGPMDVWRLGTNAGALFGIGYTKKQIVELTKFDAVFTLFDSERQAQKRAEKLCTELNLAGVETCNILPDIKNYSDPAGLSQSDADEIMRELIYESDY